MARTVGTPAALFDVRAFSANCATHAAEVICRICVQVSPSRSASAAFVCAGLACGKPAGASTSEISKAQNNFISGDPPATLLRTRIAHFEKIEFLLEPPQHFIINFIVIAHILRELAITNVIFRRVARFYGAITWQ